MDKVIVKRDGRVVPFDRERITTAIFNAATSVGGSDRATYTLSLHDAFRSEV